MITWFNQLQANVLLLFVLKTSRIKKAMFFYVLGRIPAGIYLFKVNNRNARASCKMCSKLTVKTPEQRHRYCSGVFIVVNSEHNSHLVLVFLSLTSNI